MIDEFKKFILKGNVIDLSTGVIIGAAFTGIVTAFTKGIVEPILALAGGGPNPKLSIPLPKGELDIGIIIGAIVSFLITAAVVFFVIVKPVNRMLGMMRSRDAAAAAPPPGPTPTEKLLTEILEELKKRGA
ncbi:MAG TPA: large conductance mechanosensitive channel protein MscL [Verrucomicrobiales bacterium]|jgi:large conductance mechanosensitive channel|nr:large conductance mechanosensitive channel protein MscL [Verrucomicrobiales bacterium]